MNKKLEEAKEVLEEFLESRFKISNLSKTNKMKREEKAVRTLLNHIDNSIPKGLILDKIEDYKERMRYYEEEHIIVDDEYYRYETKVEILQELLEGK